MDFALNDEQQMLQESARRFFAERHPLSRARQALPWSDESQRALWQGMADMGWLGLLAPEEQGGLNLGMCEAYLVAEAAGRQLLNLPLAASAVLLPLLLKESTQQDSQLATWVEDMAAGRSAFSATFDAMQHIDHDLQCSHQLLVYGLQAQDTDVRVALLPSASTVDAQAPAESMALDPTLRCAPMASGSAPRNDIPALGACRAWDVESENWPQRGQFLPDLQSHSQTMGQKAGEKWTAAADLQPTLPKSDRLLAWNALQIPVQGRMHALACYRIARMAELLGAAAASLDLACDHARQREQFGKPIGSYQGIKHQLANAWMALDNARLATLYAAATLDGRRPDWQFACAAAELTAIEGAQQVAHTTLQVHGGLGFTWEHDAHLYLKRIQHVSSRLGGCDAAYGLVEQTACARDAV